MRAGLRVGIVNPLTAYDFKSGGLLIRPLSFSHPFSISIIMPELRTKNPLTEIFIDSMKEEVRKITSIYEV